MADLPPPMPPYYQMTTPAIAHSLTFGNRMAVISDTGEVRIDWAAVKRVADQPDTPFFDVVSKRIAQLMLAARDGTWKPMAP